MLDRRAIEAVLPHTGRMCLLDRVLCWDRTGIRCGATSHRDTDNPLRDNNGLAAFAGIEYAAQAAAVHSALLHDKTIPRSGLLAGLKNVTTTRERLDNIAGELEIEVTLLHGDPAGGIFAFTLFSDTERILSGQFTLMYTDKKQDEPG